MALGTTDISMTAVYAELAGSSSPYAAITTPSKPWDLSTLNGVAGQNPFSFYGPWNLTVDGTTKVVAINYGASDYKLGDWRSYNHGANLPTPPSLTIWNWGPSGTTTDIDLVCIVPQLNILNADSNATYIRYNVYDTSAKRAAAYAAASPGLNRYDTAEEAWLYNSVTPLTGHIRQEVRQIQPTHVGQFVGFDTSGLSSDQIFYFDMYFAASGSDTRLVSLTDTVANAYFDVTLHKRLVPWADAVGTSVAHPTYTGAHTEINNVSGTSGSCTGVDVNQTYGSTDYSFYARVVGFSGSAYNLGPSDCTARVQHYRLSGGSYSVIETITKTGFNLNSGDSSGVRIHTNASGGTWADLSSAFQYDDYLKFDITAVTTWGTEYLCV